MTARERAHALLDELPDSEMEAVVEFIISRRPDRADLEALLEEEADELLGELDARERGAGRQAPGGVLRRMSEEEEAAGFSWDEFRPS